MLPCLITVNQPHSKAGVLMRVCFALQHITITPISGDGNKDQDGQSVCCASETPQPGLRGILCIPGATFPEFLFEYPYAQSPHGTDKKKNT